MEQVSRERGGEFEIASFVYWGGPDGLSPARRQEIETLGAWGATAADLDADGRPEIIVSNYRDQASHDVPSYIFWNSSGQFSNASRTALFTRGAVGNTVADFNGDGHADLLINNTVGRSRGGMEPVYIYRGDPRGRFSPSRRRELPGVEAYGWAAGDLDGFVTTRRTELPGSGSGAPTLADLNGDGALDLVVHGTETKPARIYFGDSTRDWDPDRGADVPGSEKTANSEVADMNRDGHLDLLCIHRGSASSYLYYGDGKGGFTPERRDIFHPLECQGVTIGDANMDGWLDVVCPTYKDGGTRATKSFMYFGGPEGLSDDRRIELPTGGDREPDRGLRPRRPERSPLDLPPLRGRPRCRRGGERPRDRQLPLLGRARRIRSGAQAPHPRPRRPLRQRHGPRPCARPRIGIRLHLARL